MLRRCGRLILHHRHYYGNKPLSSTMWYARSMIQGACMRPLHAMHMLHSVPITLFASSHAMQACEEALMLLDHGGWVTFPVRHADPGKRIDSLMANPVSSFLPGQHLSRASCAHPLDGIRVIPGPQPEMRLRRPRTLRLSLSTELNPLWEKLHVSITRNPRILGVRISRAQHFFPHVIQYTH